MKTPESPPDLGSIMKDQGLVGRAYSNPDLLPKVARYNDEYLHWDEIRRREAKDPEALWFLVRSSRLTTARRFKIGRMDLQLNVTTSAQEALHVLDTGASGYVITFDDALKGAEMDRYVVSSLMEEAIASSQLEGAVTTLKKAKKMLRENTKPSNRSERMILNNYLTMKRIKEIKEAPLSPELVLELHRIATAGTLDEAEFEGRFRADNETVVGDVFEVERVYHQPPDFKELPERVEALCSFANSKEERFVHPLVKAIAIHFMIGYLHPFVDGNGRVARALMYWYALKNNYWLFEYMAVSKVIKQSRGRYGMAYLHTETDANDLTYFVNFNLDCMMKALGNTKKYLKEKERELHESMRLVTENPELNLRQAEMLKEFIRHPDELHSIREMASRFGVVYQTARTDLFHLQRNGYVQRRMSGGKFLFRYAGKH